MIVSMTVGMVIAVTMPMVGFVISVSVVMGIPAMVMPVATTSEMADDIVKTKGDQYAPGDEWKNVAGPLIDDDTQTNDQNPQPGCEKSMAGAGEGRYAERLAVAPALPARCKGERQPMRWDGGMKERDKEASRDDRKQ